MIKVYLPTQLDSYTNGQRELDLELTQDQLNLNDVIRGLDEHFPGVAFRIVDEQGNIRRHIAIFVRESMVRDLSTPLKSDDRVQIVGALSGG